MQNIIGKSHVSVVRTIKYNLHKYLNSKDKIALFALESRNL